MTETRKVDSEGDTEADGAPRYVGFDRLPNLFVDVILERIMQQYQQYSMYLLHIAIT